MTKFLRASIAAMPSTSALGAWRADAFTADTWEHVVFNDVWVRHGFLSSYAAYQFSLDTDNRALLRIAKRYYDA